MFHRKSVTFNVVKTAIHALNRKEDVRTEVKGVHDFHIFSMSPKQFYR